MTGKGPGIGMAARLVSSVATIALTVFMTQAYKAQARQVEVPQRPAAQQTEVHIDLATLPNEQKHSLEPTVLISYQRAVSKDDKKDDKKKDDKKDKGGSGGSGSGGSGSRGGSGGSSSGGDSGKSEKRCHQERYQCGTRTECFDGDNKNCVEVPKFCTRTVCD